MMICSHAESKSFRFVLLMFNCLMTFGSYFCFDMPSALQNQFQGNVNCGQNHTFNNSSCCTDCLGLDADKYNLLYSVFLWAGAFVAVLAGYFIDKLGNQVGAIVFASFSLLGSVVFALSTMPFIRGSDVMFPMLMVGRLLLGSGNGAVRIVQDRVTAYWFRDKELAMAFGITVASSRMGSVLNFLLTESFSDKFGLSAALWGGAVLCGVGFVVAVIVGSMDKHGVEQIGQTEQVVNDSRKLHIRDLRHLGICYWLIVAVIMFYYSGILPFIADSCDFIQDEFKIDKRTASYISGAVYDVSILATPLLGYIVDEFGKRGIIAAFCGVLTVPAFCVLVYTTIHPVVSTVWMGVTYSLAAISMWSTIPLIVEPSMLGTAMGIVTCTQGIGVGLTNLLIGQILGKDNNLPRKELLHRWSHVIVTVIANVAISSVLAIILNIIDNKQGGLINRRHKRRQPAITHTEDQQSPTETDPLLPENTIN